MIFILNHRAIIFLKQRLDRVDRRGIATHRLHRSTFSLRKTGQRENRRRGQSKPRESTPRNANEQYQGNISHLLLAQIKKKKQYIPLGLQGALLEGCWECTLVPAKRSSMYA